MTPPPEDAALIRAPVLLLHGSADAIAPLEQVLTFARQMDAAKRSYRIEIFGGAAHAFTNPRFAGVTAGPLRYSAAHARRAEAVVFDYLSALHPPPSILPVVGFEGIPKRGNAAQEQDPGQLRARIVPVRLHERHPSLAPTG
jgi:hypothetical protein